MTATRRPEPRTARAYHEWHDAARDQYREWCRSEDPHKAKETLAYAQEADEAADRSMGAGGHTFAWQQAHKALDARDRARISAQAEGRPAAGALAWAEHSAERVRETLEEHGDWTD